MNAIVPRAQNSPAAARILTLVVRYQIGNPEATKSDCERYLLEDGSEGVEAILKEELEKKRGGKKQK